MAEKNAVYTKKTPAPSSTWDVEASLEFTYLLTNRQVKANKIDRGSKWNVRGSTIWDSNWTAWTAISTDAARQNAIINVVQSTFLSLASCWSSGAPLAAISGLCWLKAVVLLGGGGSGGGGGTNSAQNLAQKLKPNAKIRRKSAFRKSARLSILEVHFGGGLQSKDNTGGYLE